MAEIDKLDSFNTGLEVNAGLGANLMDRSLGLLPAHPNVVQGLLGGTMSRAVTGLSVGLEATEVIAAATDNDPATSPSVQLAGGIVSVAAPPAFAAAAAGASIWATTATVGAEYGALAGPVGAGVGLIVGGVVGYFGEGIVESALTGSATDALRAQLEASNARNDWAFQQEEWDKVYPDPRNDLVRTEIKKSVASQTGGPRGMGNDSNDPRGPWQEPGQIGDRTSGGSPAAPLPHPGHSGSGGSHPSDGSRPGSSHSGIGQNGSISGGSGGSHPSDGSKPGSSHSSSSSGGSGGSHPSDGSKPGSSHSSSSSSGSGGSHPSDGSKPGSSHSSSSSGGSGGSHPSDGSKPGSSHSSSGTRSSTEHAHKGGDQPIVFDLNGNGIEIDDLVKSTMFVDSGGDGLQHHTAWAAEGDGVLFYDVDGNGMLSEKREYVFTEWDATADDDMQALRGAFDSNGDGKLTSADAKFADFKVLVTKADGSTEAKTLTELGITEINLKPDATRIVLPDGSVINGQSTFTRSNGTTGIAANTTLMAEEQGHRVVQTTTTDGSGNRTVISTGYAADGEISFVIRSVTSANGSSVINTYDTNGDGVVDQRQSLTTVTNAGGSKTETLINVRGADAATAVTLSRVVTTTSADGKTVTIQRDSTGGGWFDQTEAHTTSVAGVRTTVFSDLAQNGAVIRSSTETISADGMTRSLAANIDGIGAADLTTTHTISEDIAGTRTETITLTNQDGSLRSSETEVVSADTRSKNTYLDQDGDGDTDTRFEEQTTLVAGGGMTSKAWVRNGDNSLRTEQDATISADGLTKTVKYKFDGDTVFDRTTVDATVIDASGNRTHTVTQTNADGSVFGMTKETLGADKVTAEIWVDENQNGVFEATDLTMSVVVNATTHLRTTVSYDRNGDGSFSAKQTETASEDGLTRSRAIDADGDGDIDVSVSDVTVKNADLTSTQTVTTSNQNASLNHKELITTSADGLTTTMWRDIDGNGTWDGKTVDAQVRGVDGSSTQTVSSYAGNGTTLLGRSTTFESANRLSQTVTIDSNGDGATDSVTSSVTATSGTMVVTQSIFYADGDLAQRTISSISANGLVASTTTDINGDGIIDLTQSDTTVLAANGSQVRTVQTLNSDGSLRGSSVTTVSDDKLQVTAQTDADGDGVIDHVSDSTTAWNSNGSQVETTQERAGSGVLLSQVRTTTSDDGWVLTAEMDADGDGDFDLTQTSTTTLLVDGGKSTLSELRNASGGLRVKSVTAVSDDGKTSQTQLDVNGDGTFDRVTSRVEALNGAVTVLVSDYASNGALQSRSEVVTSDDGLVQTLRTDSDGDAVFEQVTTDTTLLNADGSQTRTINDIAANGTVWSTATTVTSDDGLVTSRSQDVTGDGVTDFSSVRTISLSSAGVQTTTVLERSANNTLLTSDTITVSADKRTMTESRDADGNGQNDQVTATVIDAGGMTTRTSSYYSTGGALESTTVVTVSGDGLSATSRVDRNGDGRFDLIETRITTLDVDGSAKTQSDFTDDRYVSLAGFQIEKSDDGLRTEVLIDLDGDGVIESRAEDVTSLLVNGDVLRVQESFDATATRIGQISSTTSGNGLDRVVISDYTGDGSADRISEYHKLADGASTQTTGLYAAGGRLAASTQTVISADGRNTETVTDLNGDGAVDQHVAVAVDLSRTTVTSYEDIGLDGAVTSRVTETRLANGSDVIVTHDFDGDGTTELLRETTVSTAANGSTVYHYAEHLTPFFMEFGIGRLTYDEVTTTSANGLQSTTLIDSDGDGDIDGTRINTTTIRADGGRDAIETITYADGSLRYSGQTSISADGRLIQDSLDNDGNGIADKIGETQVFADGRRIDRVISLNEAGVRGQVFVTTTSADGLNTSILRAGIEQTIIRSAVNNGSYVWNNGLTAAVGVIKVEASHQIDSLGLETWTVTQNWVEGTTAKSSITTVRLDEVSKVKIMSEAARIYDAVLDREMDITETEALAARLVDGQLDKVGLTTALLGSSEFAARYGTITDAEYLTQVYLNTLGRGPALDELNEDLRDIAAGVRSRAVIASALAESVEHVVVGNGHLATNNFDVIMNPAVFERSLDTVYITNLVTNLIDVVYDRDPTAQELSYLSDLLLKGTANADDVAVLLLAVKGDIQGASSASLNGLSGAALVEQAFVNALGRQPTAEEQYAWQENLSANRITAAQFVASLAQSIEHQADGIGHQSAVIPTVTSWTGTAVAETKTGGAGQDSLSGLAGNDTINGGDGSDRIIGGLGIDSLDGGNGNDFYSWTRGDGNDIINDTGASRLERDQLILTNATSAQATVARGGSGNNGILLSVSVSGVTEVIELRNALLSATSGAGIESISFSDGVVWTLEDLLAKVVTNGTTGNDSLTGTGFGDNLQGVGGNDTLNGGDGNDQLQGGAGADLLQGGNGNDEYNWAAGHGNDTISDVGASQTEIDQLSLWGISPSSVALSRINGSNDLQITVTGSAGTEVLVIKDQFASVTAGNGIELISFAGGSTWNLEDILTRTTVVGGTGNDSISGTAQRDNVLGGFGNDTLSTAGGDDTLTGGVGVDSLTGSAGSDTYVWSKGDGNDSISDGSTGTIDTDVLVLTDVASSEVDLRRGTGTTTLKVLVGSELISVVGHFSGTQLGAGIEEIRFADGVIWTAADILAHTRVIGNSSGNSQTGMEFMDNFFGYGGDDTIAAAGGDDLIVGGAGNDAMDGAAGNDRFEWTSGDGNDQITDSGTALSEVDTLALTNVSSGGAVLAKSGNNLTVTIGTEVLTINNQFLQTAPGNGIEMLEYGDGVLTKVMNTAVAELQTLGTTAANTLTGWVFRDVLTGLAGNDTISGAGGDDWLIGGTGVDSLDGGTGSDRYVWVKGDGNDILNDTGDSRVETDTLALTNVGASDVSLKRVQGSWDLQVKIISTGEIITIKSRFVDGAHGYGVEAIEFADGSTWYSNDIFEQTRLDGTSGNDSLLSGTSYADNIYGGDGNDTISGLAGNDVLDGGTGADAISDTSGSETYVWRRGDGADTITDSSTVLTETDTFKMTGVASTDVTVGQVTFTRASGSNNLQIAVTGTSGTELITFVNQFGASVSGNGIERVEFSDGVTWDLPTLLANVKTSGGGGNDSLSGLAERDNLFGLAGNDTLIGNAGGDYLYGGLGTDSLAGGDGSDWYYWASGDGADTVNDVGTSNVEVDTLVLTNVNSTDVGLRHSSGSSDMIVRVADAGGAYTDLRVVNEQNNPAIGYGIERIIFADGVEWTFQDILDRIATGGTGIGETLTGTAFDDKFWAYGGNDTIAAGAGNDDIAGGDGSDSIDGGTGVDIASYYNATQGVSVDLRLTAAQTGVAGGSEVGDILISIENLGGSNYGDTLSGDDNSNNVYGNSGNDLIHGYDGYDGLYGGAGNDTVYGDSGADILNGGSDQDSIYGGDGDDTVDGDAGNDQLYGGVGADILQGDDGNDMLYGGNGSDTFIFTNTFGADQIMDFTADDHIELASSSAITSYADLMANHVSQSGSDVLIADLLGNTILIKSFTVAALAEDVFIF